MYKYNLSSNYQTEKTYFMRRENTFNLHYDYSLYVGRKSHQWHSKGQTKNEFEEH